MSFVLQTNNFKTIIDGVRMTAVSAQWPGDRSVLSIKQVLLKEYK